MTGFEDWSKLIQQALIWLDQPDPLGAMEEMKAMDTTEEFGRYIDVLKKHAKPQVKMFTVAICTKLADKQETDRYYHRRYVC